MSTVHRLMSAEEIALQRTSEPDDVRLPSSAGPFAERAARLAIVAPGHDMGAYLELIAAMATAQDAVLARCVKGEFGAPPLPSASSLAQATDHQMPPLPVATLARDPVWRELLLALLSHLRGADTGLSDQTLALFDRLASASPDWLDDQAKRFLNERELQVDPAAAVFIAAALQVYWSWLVQGLDTTAVRRLPTATVCPCCGSRPLVSIMRQSGNGTHRYLACRLCATEWYYERIKCVTCESTEGIEYLAIDAGDSPARAETCPACHTYTKILATDKVIGVEPLADDLASLALDMVLAEQTDFLRASVNPAFFPGDGHDDAS